MLTNGDGLLVVGRTLYVVQNQLNTVAVIRLDRAGTSGRLIEQRTDPAFQVPTTIAKFGRGLYLPNARFRTPRLRTQRTQWCASPGDTSLCCVAVPELDNGAWYGGHTRKAC